MGRIKDFKTKFENVILAIDPSSSAANGLGYAIINLDAEKFGGSKNKPFLKSCGLITPFSTDSRLAAREDICDQIKNIWINEIGFSKEPLVLAIEKPAIYPNSPIRHEDILNLSALVGMLCRTFKAKHKTTPSTLEWKRNGSKDKTKDLVLSCLDYNSKKALERDLGSIAISKRHNVFDAIGIGLFIGNVLSEKKAMPADLYTSKEYF